MIQVSDNSGRQITVRTFGICDGGDDINYYYYSYYYYYDYYFFFFFFIQQINSGEVSLLLTCQ
jgi:hypothetical protein